MPETRWPSALRLLLAEVPDADLLDRYVQCGDNDAFSQLVKRYARLVWGQCRNLLPGEADADDAFQATFLALSHSAKKLQPSIPLGPWLHGVAYRVCQNARRGMARRSKREKASARGEGDNPVADSTWETAFAVAAEEVQKLPATQRTAFVLCGLEGRSHGEAAAVLGLTPNTLAVRLMRAKETLLKRLAKRGLGATALVLGGAAANAPASAIEKTSDLLASGSVIPNSIQSLLNGVLFMPKFPIQLVVAALLLAGLGVGLGGFRSNDATAQVSKEPKAKPSAPFEISRSIGKEPKYTGTPRYCLLALDADAKERVWLVHDGDALYVDRNGNGDLTDECEKISAKKTPDRGESEFENIEFTVNGKTHKISDLMASRIGTASGEWALLNGWAEAALEQDKEALAYVIEAEVHRAGLKGNGEKGRLEFRIALDQNGILCFHKDRKQAPIIHFAAPFEFQFQFGEPTLYIGGDNEFRMIVGSPGYGPGTLAACFYDGLIPENAKPTATITYPTAKPDEKPRVETIALQGRTCRVNLYGEPKPGDVPGSATVEFSFDEWKEGKVMPLKLGVSIQPAPPRTGPPAEKVSGLLSASLKHPDRTSSFGSLQYSPDSKRLMTVGYPSGTIQFWDVATRQEKFTVQTNKGVRTSMDFAFLTPDWKTLFTSTQEENSKLVERDGKKVNEHRNSGRIRRWDLETKKELEPFNPPKGQGNIAAGMTSDGKYLYSAEVKDFNPGARFEMPLILLDASTGTRNEIGAGSYFHGQFFLPDNKSILLCSTKTFTVKSVPDGKVIATKTFDGEPGRHTQVVGISPDGKLIARNLGQEKDGTTSTVFLDAKTLDETARWTGQANPQQFGTTLGTFTPDSKQFLILDGKNDLQIWDVAAKKVARTIPVSIAGQNWRVAVSADSRWVAYPWMPKYESKNLPSRTTDPNEEPQTHIALVNLVDPNIKPIELIAPRGTAGAIAFRPDGKELALGSTGGVHLFDLTKLGKK